MKNILLNSDKSSPALDHQSVCLFSQIQLYLIMYLLQLELGRHVGFLLLQYSVLFTVESLSFLYLPVIS